MLRSYRERAGISQEKLGFAANIHRNYISDTERGARNPTFEVLGRWLVALGITWTEFGEALDRSRHS